MRTRLKALNRLADLYQVVERAEQTALSRAQAAVREAEVALEQQTAARARLTTAGQTALLQGDFTEWRLNDAQLQVVASIEPGLLQMRRDREALLLSAAERYRSSRVQLEQINSVAGQLRSKLQEESSRNEQRISDDRYLSRQRWLQQRRERKQQGLQGTTGGSAPGPDTNSMNAS